MRVIEKSTKEAQYKRCLDVQEQKGLTRLGIMSNQTWVDDPRRLVFLLARYKFVSKMFSGKNNVLEVGCADAFGTRIVMQEVKSITAIDFDPIFIEDVNDRMDDKWKFTCINHDMLSGPVPPGNFDAAYSLDVIEHISRKNEKTFIANIAESLKEDGTLIIGSPSIHSQQYASPLSKEGHVNCKDAIELRTLVELYFKNVFIFSMNDEIVHTGFYPMAHYLFALCVGKK